MENADFICVPTVIQRAAKRGVKAALLTCKVKTIHLLGRGAEIAVAAEAPPGRSGSSATVNRQTFIAARSIIGCGRWPSIFSSTGTTSVSSTSTRRTIRCILGRPAAAESKEHLATLDRLLEEARVAAPDAAFLLTADHGMNYKSRCWDLFKACRDLGTEVRFALSAEKDRYVKHHRTFGGAAWVWLKSPKDESKVAETLMGLKGVEAVLAAPRRRGQIWSHARAHRRAGGIRRRRDGFRRARISDGGTRAGLPLAWFAPRVGHSADYL